jgi:hypothetical protein
MAQAGRDLPHDFPDRALREALVQGDNLRALLRAVAPDVAELLDYDRLEVLKPAYLLDDWRRRDNDVLIRLPMRESTDGREILLCVLVEHQSTTDQAMPLRMLVYAVLYWEQEWKAWQDAHPRGEPLRLTPVLPVVLHTGQEPWDTSRSLTDLFDVPAVLKAWLPSWAMPLWDLAEHSADELLRTDEAFWQALAVARAERADPGDFLHVLAEAMRRMEPLGTSRPVYWHELLRLVLYWALYRRPPREHANLIDKVRGSHTNVQLQQEVQTMTQQIWKVGPEAWFEEGEAKGQTEGELRAYRTMLQSQLQKKFHHLPEPILQRIAAADLERLKAACLQVLDLRSLDELQL